MQVTEPRNLVSPSPVFYGLVAVTFLLGAMVRAGFDARFMLFLFVVAGWVLTLTMHEFGHAVVAYIGGDTSVVHKGYLTLDVRKYLDPVTALVMPVLFLVLGGIGLPGGAVWIRPGAIRSPLMRSLTSAAGPFANGICAILCLLPLRLGLIDANVNDQFVLGLAFLGWLQVIAMVFNLVPIPGLDGFGIIEPHLSRDTLRAVAPFRQYGIWVFIAAIWFVEPVRTGFFELTDTITQVLGGDLAPGLRDVGWFAFRFWEN